MSEQFYITTAIDYPNGSPHMGHAYEKIVTDFYVRWYRLMGLDSYFLTGTDENGQKLIQAAEEAGTPVMPFLDQQVEKFRKLCKDLEITNDDFIRTTEDRHANVAKQVWLDLEKNDDIYFGKYSGMYCYSCENFYTETDAPDGDCPHHHKPLVQKEEEGYFLKMSKYNQWIIDYIKGNPEFIMPKKSYNEIMSRLEKEPLRDLAISRPNQGHGITVPENDKFVMYTWFDALINYYSALDDNTKKYWPAEVHVIGKDIVWFHTVIWPIMLHASGREIPRQVYVHGMILASDGKKMSKSLGNVIDPNLMIEKYPVDTFRYYLLRAISATSDGAFIEQEMVDKHNNELANDFGNLLMRVIKFAKKKLGDEIKAGDYPQEFDFQDTLSQMKEFVDKREHNKALDVLWEAVNKANQYMNDKAPWGIKDDPTKLEGIIYNLLFSIHNISVLLAPAMPEVSKLALKMISIEPEGEIPFNNYGKSPYLLGTPEILFQKIDQ